jgi:hypothetical protein
VVVEAPYAVVTLVKYKQKGKVTMDKAFDKKEHAKLLLDIEGTIIGAFMLSKGLSDVDQIDYGYAVMASGAFRVLSVALEKAYDDICKAGSDFIDENGLSYPFG